MSDKKRSQQPSPPPDEPTLLRTCNRCGEVRNWTVCMCQKCGDVVELAKMLIGEKLTN